MLGLLRNRLGLILIPVPLKTATRQRITGRLIMIRPSLDKPSRTPVTLSRAYVTALVHS